MSSCLGVWRDESKCIVNDDASSPGMGPIPNSCIVFGRHIKTRHTTLFCFCAICGQQKGEEIKPGSILRRRATSAVRCCVPFSAVICGIKWITIIHLRVLNCSAASVAKRWKSNSSPVAGTSDSAGWPQQWKAISFQAVTHSVTPRSS